MAELHNKGENLPEKRRSLILGELSTGTFKEITHSRLVGLLIRARTTIDSLN